MDIVAGISAATEAIKLTKEIRNIDGKNDKAELKLRFVNLIDQLLFAKEALQNVRGKERLLAVAIDDLKQATLFRAKLEDEKGYLYKLDENGNRAGVPYCNLCFVRDGKLYRLKHQLGSEYSHPHYWCDNCETAHDE